MPTTVTSTIKSSGGDYTSLSAWEAAKQGDLVTADQLQKAECYAFTDTTLVVIDGSTTDTTRYMQIVCAAGNGHSGYYDITKYRIRPTGVHYAVLNIADDYVRVAGLQLVNVMDDNSLSGVTVGAGNEATIDSCLVTRLSKSYTNGNNSFGFKLGTDRTKNVFVSNCVVHDWDFGVSKTGNVGYNLINGAGPPGKAYLYNCLANVPNGIGFSDGYTDVIAKNCLATGCTNGFNGSFDSNSDYNASDLSADAPGTNARNSQTFTFINADGGDYRLTASDTGALGFGVDLSADGSFPVSTDITGATCSEFSIGPFDNFSTGSAINQPIYINCGNDGIYTDASSVIWESDTFYSGTTNTYNNFTAISGTTEDRLYQSERYGNPINYNIPVPNGVYVVTLKFAELYFGAGGGGGSGSRVIDVTCEGVLVIDDLDIFNLVGALTAYDVSFTTTVSDGSLDIVFTASADQGKINAIQVIPVDSTLRAVRGWGIPGIVRHNPGAFR